MTSRLLIAAILAGAVVAACGTESSGGTGSTGAPDASPPADGGGGGNDAGPPADAGNGGGGQDAGTGGGGQDAGTTGGGDQDGGSSGGGGGGQDAGTTGGGGGGGQDAGTTGGGGQDGGTQANDCDGLMPGAPGSGTQFVWPNRDLNGSAGGFCDRGETDGTGHIALRWQHSFQPGDTQFAFVDPATNTQAGSYDRGTVLLLVGQASGFMGTNCLGAECDNNYVVLDPIGNELYASPFDRKSGRSQANDPTGGMVRASFPTSSDFLQSANPVLDAIDAAGKIRWTRTLPDPLRVGVDEPGLIGVDRKGDVLAIWPSDARYGKGTFAGQWFDHDGNPGPVFQVMLPAGTSPNALFERVGDGLFLAGGAAGQPSWLGQFDARATALTPPPGWLAARPGKTLHMVHGGAGYAVLPQDAQQSANCEQQVEVISPSGQSCGTATFSFGGGSCTTGTIAVGYDGTVVQQGPRERETCSAADHVCTCTYRYWPGFFR